ncbi:MAG: hypothetical protein V4719_10785 [Planctomycetota bacterium]
MEKKRQAKTPVKKAAGKKRAPIVLPEMRCFVASDSAGRLSFPGNGEKTFLLGMFDAVSAPRVPAMLGPFFLFVQLYGGSGECTATITGQQDDGTPVVETESPLLSLMLGHKRELFTQIQLLPFTKFGAISFVLRIEGTQVGWPLVLNLTESPMDPTESPQ